MSAITPVVAVHHDISGVIHYLVPPDVTLLIIDDRTLCDRVYRYDTTTTPEQIAALVGDSPIGHSGDGYLSGHEVQAIRAALWRADGNALAVVPAGPVEDE